MQNCKFTKIKKNQFNGIVVSILSDTSFKQGYRPVCLVNDKLAINVSLFKICLFPLWFLDTPTDNLTLNFFKIPSKSLFCFNQLFEEILFSNSRFFSIFYKHTHTQSNFR